MSWSNLRDGNRTVGSQGPSARNYHTATLLGHTMYVIGGTNGDQFYQDVHEFNIETKTWREMDIRQSGSKSAMTARSRHSAVGIGGNVYVFGGVFAGFGKTSGGNEVFILDTSNRRWVKPKASGRIPQPRFAHCAAAIDDRMYVFGGHDGQAALNDLYYFDAAKASWTHPATPAGTPPPPSHNYTMVAAAGDLYILGGPGGFETVYMLKLGRELCWLPVTCTGSRPSPRLQFSCSVVSSPDSELDSLYIFGGGSREGQVFNDTFVLELAASGPCRWRREPVSGTIPATRIGHSTVYAPLGTRRELLVFGGTDRQTFLADMFILDLDAVMAFSRLPIGGTPPLQRVGQTATQLATTTSSTVAIVGGDSMSEVRGDLIFLKEAAGRWTWSRVPDKDVSKDATTRVSHTATAVGNRLFVFGGGDLKSCRNDLWIADVNSSTWSWTNNTGKVKGDNPPPRAGHTATHVRDGDQDFIFFIGGFSDREYRADVYRLDVTPGRSMRWDICLPSIAGGAASLRGKMMTPRLGHSASLVRERIYIFGGSLRGNAIDNDLYEFNPMGGAFSWAKVKVHGEPPCRRFGHSASVIQGVRPRIFVVGGLGAPSRSPELLNDVHVFDVETSTWSSPRVKGTEDFEPRCRHSAIVHKDDILIFGGCVEEEGRLTLFRLNTSPGRAAGT